MSKLTENLPRHNMYVELFSGTKSMLFTKLPSTSELYNDTNKDIVDFFEVLRNDLKSFSNFIKTGIKPESATKVEKWDRLKELYENFVRTLVKGNLNSITGYRDISKSLENELSSVDDYLVYIVKRLRMVQLENRRFDDIISRFDSKNSLFYVDVTNLPKDVCIEELVDSLLKINGKGIVYGASSEKYSILIDEGWMRLHGEGQENTWINYRI